VGIGLRHLRQGAHDVTTQAVLVVGKDRSIERVPEQTRFLDRGDEVVTRRTVNGQVAHLAELNRLVLVTPRLRARPIDRSELVK
jgi:hypothetical protein